MPRRQGRSGGGDADELAELRERVISEAPEAGSNPLLTDAEEVEADGKVTFSRARRFSELPLSRRTLAGLARGKWEKMTDVQRATIGHALAGRDVLAAARTGSGKTLAFLVPLLELLWRERWSALDRLGGLVVSPTRELALQIFDVLRTLGQKHDLSAGLVIGGKDQQEEAARIAPMNILVATPGRLLHHIDQTAGFDLSNVKMLVLDEADRLLDLGFKQTMAAILEELPRKRQTLLFSATQTRRVADLASLSLSEPQYISVHAASKTATPTRLQHHHMLIEPEQKLDVLWGFVRSHLQAKTICFLSSCKQVAFVHAAFSALRPGVSLLCLHGRQKQMKRLAVYTEFCAKKHAVLFATDVAARGLDFPTVQWVVQADAPEDVATYIHRTGRTARHTASGRALLLLSPSEKAFVDQLSAARIATQRLRPNKQQVHALAPKLRALLSQRADIKYTAQRALVSYVRSVKLQADKAVFDASSLPLQKLAESYGLAAAPRVRSLSGGGKAKEAAKNWAGAGEGRGEASGEEGASEAEEGEEEALLAGGGASSARGGWQAAGGSSEGDEESEESEGGGEDGLVLPGRARKVASRNKLLRLLDRNTAERRGSFAKATREAGEAGALAAEADDLLTVKRTFLPAEEAEEAGGAAEGDAEGAEGITEAAAAPPRPKKIKIRKGGTVAGGKRTVFDEDGRPLEERLGGEFSAVVSEKGAAAAAQDPELRARAVREALAATADADRERERRRVRERHQLQKQKRKAAVAEADGLDAQGRPKQSGGVAVLGSPEGDEEGGSEGGEGGEGGDSDAGGAEAPPRAERRRVKRARVSAQGVRNDEERAEDLLARLLPQ